MTAHHPFTIPEDKKILTLPKRYQDNMVGDYITAQHYADNALGQFITDLKDSGLWDNSIIVIYGDHLGIPQHALDKRGHQLMNEIYGYDYSYKDMINIPLILSIPDTEMPEQREQLGGQIDIAPTLANLLGVSMDNQIHFGQDLFNQSNNLLPQRYYLPSGSFLNEETLFISGSDYHDGVEYSLRDDNNEQAVTTTKKSQYERALELLHLSNSYIRQLPDR
ncbi:Lipoteichoic acid synthase [compost metagenome]